MKRYVRLKTNEIVDTEHEEVDKYLFERILGNSFIAESNSILDLIQVGDLVQTDFYKTPLLVIKRKYSKQYGAEYIDLTLFKFWLDENEDHKITQIYTKQGDNYILVWDKERGVI